MESRTFKYDVKELGLSTAKIVKTIGYTPDNVPANLIDIIEGTLQQSLSLDSVKAEYHIYSGLKINPESASIIIDNIVFNTRKIILSQLKGASGAVLFLATAGPEIGISSKEQMASGDLLEGYITDVIGTEIVEAAADLMQEHLAGEARAEGLNITNRFSPGYCGWDVSEQHKLFRCIPDNYCGINLNESALMNPVKSVSGLIGIGREARYRPYSCSRCDSQNCIYRNRK